MIIAKKYLYGYRENTSYQYSLYVLIPVEKHLSVCFEYGSVPANVYNSIIRARGRDTDIIKPIKYSFMKAKDLYSFKSEIGRSTYGTDKGEYCELDGTPEEYGLYVPKNYQRKKLEFVKELHPEITKEMVEAIDSISSLAPTVIVGEDYYVASGNSGYYGNREIYELACPKCKKVYRPNPESRNGYNCPYCNAGGNTLVMKEMKSFREAEYDARKWGSAKMSEPTNQKEKYIYLKPVKEGLTLYVLSKEIRAEKESIFTKYNVEYKLNHFVGKEISCKKYMKRGQRDADSFEALNINTKNITRFDNVIYEGFDDFFDFSLANEQFLKKCGFQSALKFSPIKLDLEPFFILYIAILNKYPVLEQIIKMGHARLFFNLYQSMVYSMNKAEINEKIEKMNELVNPDATKGKEALRFPIYIGDYLLKRNAPIEEYFYWRDVYEITHLSKEQFENFIESFSYAWVSSQAELEDVGNILKFGYPVEKLFTYILKQSKTHKTSVRNVITNLTDYLNMCDLSEIEPDMYPQDVKKQHDDMLIYFKRKEKLEYDKKLTLIGVECERYVVPEESELDNIGIPKLFKEYIVVFPKTEQDFIVEGNQQHNCVGSYPRNVRNGNCVVFFIRKKDTPNKSFITAECIRSGLGQCFYSNNRPVNDENLIKFARYIANKIKAGVSSGKIHALNNV